MPVECVNLAERVRDRSFNKFSRRGWKGAEAMQRVALEVHTGRDTERDWRDVLG